MKPYTIDTVPNPLCRRVSVPKVVREAVAKALDGLPYVDRAEAMPSEATQIHIMLSTLAEEQDIADMETLIKGMVE